MPFYQPLSHHQDISVAVRKENGDAVVFDGEGNRSIIMISKHPCPVNDFNTLVKFGFEQWQAAQQGRAADSAKAVRLACQKKSKSKKVAPAKSG